MRIQDEPEGRWYKNYEVVDIVRINFVGGLLMGTVIGVVVCMLLRYLGW